MRFFTSLLEVDTVIPSTITWPELGCIIPANMRNVVVFPAPLGPSSEKTLLL